MKRVMKRRQAGVVLVFSLLILLLVTLLGVNMVQQNRVQFLMAANAQQQMTTFSDAEDVLRLAEEYIDRTRYKPVPAVKYTCESATLSPSSTTPRFNQLKPQDITGKLKLSSPNILVKIIKTSCLVNVPAGGKPPTLKVVKECFKGQPYPCNQTYVPNNSITCPTEIYTLLVTIMGDSGSKREIEEKYGVRCDL